MTNIERLRIRIPEAANDSDARLEDILSIAEDVILSKCFASVENTSGEDISKALTLHNEKVLAAAVVIYNMQGVEGQVAHSENGIVRTYAESEGLQPILNRITTRCNVV